MPSFPWSLRQINALIQERELSPLEIVQATASAVRQAEPAVQAWCHSNLDAALQRAEILTAALERSPPVSPLHGATYGAKDIFDTAGLPTEWGSATQRGRVPSDDCELVAALDSLGCVLAGKTHTTAYAYYDTGPTRNPLAAGHTPGGSSSGSAAAVGAGMVPLAIGEWIGGGPVQVAGPVGIASVVDQAARLGLDRVLFLGAILSAQIGLINLLPWPGLDGGRLVFVGFEWLTGRRLNPRREAAFHFVGIMLLMALAVVVTVSDVQRLVGF